MSSRPEILFPLFGAITNLDGIGPKTGQLLSEAGISRPRDLLMTLPFSGVDRGKRQVSVISFRLLSQQLRSRLASIIRLRRAVVLTVFTSLTRRLHFNLYSFTHVEITLQSNYLRDRSGLFQARLKSLIASRKWFTQIILCDQKKQWNSLPLSLFIRYTQVLRRN